MKESVIRTSFIALAGIYDIWGKDLPGIPGRTTNSHLKQISM